MLVCAIDVDETWKVCFYGYDCVSKFMHFLEHDERCIGREKVVMSQNFSGYDGMFGIIPP